MSTTRARSVRRRHAGWNKPGTLLCAALLVGGIVSGAQVSRSQVSPLLVQAKTGGGLNVHELSLLANAPLGNLDAIEGALSRGADVNAQDAAGQTALMLTADYNSHRGGQVSDEFKRLLRASGMSASTGGGSDGSLFWYLHSVADIDTEPARYLLREGAVQRLSPTTHIPILVWQPTSGNTDVLQALIRRGADANARDKDGRTALIHAARNINMPTLRLLLQNRAEVNARDAAGVTALGYAAQSGDTQDVQMLLANGAVVDARSADGPFLLRYAIGQHDIGQVRALLDQGAAATGSGFESPLMAAVSSNNEEAAELLIERGADVNAGDSRAGDSTPLAMAVDFFLHDRMAQFLLRHGADPNGKGAYGNSVFLRASMTGSVPLLQTFVDMGANVNTRDTNGDTPLLMALLGFSHAGADVDAAALSWRDKQEAGTFAVVKLLVQKGANVNAADVSGETPLVRAIHRQQLNIARYLIERGADVNARTVKGETPLAWAIRFHQEAIADALRAAGAKE